VLIGKTKEGGDMASSALIRVGGLAAMVGGLLWIVKGGSILITGQQPPVVFEAALPLFALGLLGLHARLRGHGGPLGKAGILVTYAALAAAVLVLVAPLPSLYAVAGFGPFLGMVLLGSATLQAKVFPPLWSALPLAMGLGGALLILAGGGLALMSERLLEIPIVLVGLAWMLLGYSVLAVEGTTVKAPARVR
jgi:hypothetical protein